MTSRHAFLLALPFAAFAVPAMSGGLSAPIVQPAITPVAVAPVPSADWTGLYAGASLGYGRLNVRQDGDDDEIDADGIAYGVHVGYLHDLGSIVLGAELAYQIGNFEPDDSDEDADYDTARILLRAGYDAGSFLPYLTAGYATAELADTGLFEDMEGPIFGLGVDYAVSDRILIGAEYLRHDIDSLGDIDVPDDADVTIDTLSLRASYRF